MGQDQTINFRAIECRISCYDAKEAAKAESMGMPGVPDEDIWVDCVFDMTKAIFVKPRGIDNESPHTNVAFEADYIIIDIPFQTARELFIQSRYRPSKNPMPL